MSDVVSGVTLTLNEVTTEPVTITVTRDADAAIELIQEFVDELNAVVGQIKIATAYDADSEIAAPLQGASTARSLVTGLRAVVSDLYDSLSGDHTFAASVGITLTREGTFELDVDKLRTELEDDFPPVAAFFEGDGTAGGLASAIDEFLDGVTGSGGSIQPARDRWQAQIDNTTEAIRRMEDRVDRREAALFAQFARLETAMSQLSGVAAALAPALPGLQS